VAKAGQRWWEIDVTWWAIQTLNTLGLAKKIVTLDTQGSVKG
jgi:stearoyl-CoA desaturase (delta-9 desaturase)